MVLIQQRGATMSEAHLAQSYMPAILTPVPARSYFLTRPQLLTRIDPLPVGRDIARKTEGVEVTM
jgi:hypothetical protein